LKKQVGAALIRYRFSLNQYTDRGCDRPGDVKKEYWDILVEKRGTEEAKEKSAKMAEIARGRGSRNTTKNSVRDSVIVNLVSKCTYEIT